MWLHTRDLNLQRWGCRALCHSVRNQEAGTDEVASIELVLGAMRCHPCDVEIQRLSCEILGSLARHPEHRDTIVDNLGLEVRMGSRDCNTLVDVFAWSTPWGSNAINGDPYDHFQLSKVRNMESKRT